MDVNVFSAALLSAIQFGWGTMEQENSKAGPERTAGKTQSQHLNRDAETEKTMTEENKNGEADHLTVHRKI